MSILVNVVNQKMYVSSTMESIVTGSQQFVKFRFNLSDEWDGLLTFAQFRQNGVAYNQYLDEENAVYLPAEIGAGACTLMLYGSKDKVIGTTNYLTLKIDENILVSDASSTDISESLYTQLVSKVDTLSKKIVDKVSKTGITLGLHSDGKYYIFVDGAPVGTGFELSGNGGDVFGYVDENNNIVLNGNLTDGSYNIKYEMEDGSTVDIGNLVLDTNVYYTVTNNLTNCVNSNGDTQVIVGQAYTATITANDGYELSSVVVTMGGSAVSVSGGNINIASVTGNIVITAVAEKTTVEITNWIEEVGYTADTRLSLSSGNTTTASGYECTGFIPAKYGDVIYLRNVELTDENATNIVFYDSEKNPLVVNTSGLHGTTLYYLFVTKGTQAGDVYSSALVAEGALVALPKTFAFIRIGSTSITDESILTVNQEIV